MKRCAAMLLSLLSLVGIICGCSNNDSPGTPLPPSNVLKANIGLDVSQVRGFLIAPVAKKSQLSAIKSDGSLTVAEVVEGEASNDSVSPFALFDTSTFAVLQYSGVKANGKTCSLVAMRKSDGAMFCVEASPTCGDGVGCYFSTIQSDSSGNLLYVSSYSSGLFKIDLTDLTNPTMSTLVDGTDGAILDMAVNADGDALVSVVNGGGSSRSWRVYKAGGGFQGVSTSIYNTCATNGSGADNNNFFYTDMATGTAVVYKLTKSGTTFASTTYFTDTGNAIGFDFCDGGGSIYKTADRMFQGFRRKTHRNYFVEALNAGATPVRHTVSAFDEVMQIRGYMNGLFILGQDALGNGGLVRFDPASSTFATLLTPGDYSISAFDVSPIGEVTFSGRRVSDNARILGMIPADQSSIIVNPIDVAGDVQQLVRLR